MCKNSCNCSTRLKGFGNRRTSVRELVSRLFFDRVENEDRGLVGDIVQALKDRLLNDNDLFRNAKIFGTGNSENLNVDDFHVCQRLIFAYLSADFTD